MSIPVSIDPLGTLDRVEVLASCGLSLNSAVRTGIIGLATGMGYEFKIEGVPTDGTVGANYSDFVSCYGASRRNVRLAQKIYIYSGTDSLSSVEYALAGDIEAKVNYTASRVECDVNGSVKSAALASTAEPGIQVSLATGTALAGVYVRFVYFRIFYGDELVSDIVPARVGGQIVLWDRVRKITLLPERDPLKA